MYDTYLLTYYSKHTFNKRLSIADKPLDAFRGQSRSPNMVPFHTLGMVSHQCAIVTLSLKVFQIFDFKKCCDLEIRSEVTQCLKVVPFDRLGIVSC